MQRFMLFPTTVRLTNVNYTALVVGNAEKALDAGDSFSVLRRVNGEITKRIGRFECHQGRVMWAPRRACGIDFNGPMLIYDADAKLVGTVQPVDGGKFTVDLTYGHALNIDPQIREMLCPMCGHLEDIPVDADGVSCTYCQHYMSTNWTFYMSQYNFAKFRDVVCLGRYWPWPHTATLIG